MQNILEEPIIREQTAKLSIDQYHRLIELGEVDQRVELIFGHMIYKMSKSPLHSSLVAALLQFLNNHLDTNQYIVRKEESLTIANSEPEPDLAIIKGALKDFTTHGRRLLKGFGVSAAELTTAIKTIRGGQKV
ncbi:MAG: Uma2 family endonuclease, partial [Verrucomicrobiota bacterium]